MSRLQNLVNSLINVIIGYNEIQTKNKYSLATLLQKPDELESVLKGIIKEATTSKNYNKRLNLLNYFLSEITLLKPLVDKNEPLDEKASKEVENHLIALITTARKLLETYQTDTISITVNDKKEELVGVLYGGMMGGFCQSGNVLNRWLADTTVFPSGNFAAKDFIKSLIDEHQNALLVPFLSSKTKELQESRDQLQRELELLKEEKIKWASEKEELEKQLQSLKPKDGNSIEEELKRLRTENAQLKSRISTTPMLNGYLFRGSNTSFLTGRGGLFKVAQNSETSNNTFEPPTNS